MLNSEAEDMNIRVVATLIIVAHLEKGPVRSEVLLQGLECSTVKRELERTTLKAHLIMKSAARRDSANLVQVLALTPGCNKLNTDRDLAIAVIVNLSLDLLAT